jgi:hypothetical protein
MKNIIRRILREERLLIEASKLDILINKIGLNPDIAKIFEDMCGSLSVWVVNKYIDYFFKIFSEKGSEVNKEKLLTLSKNHINNISIKELNYDLTLIMDYINVELNGNKTPLENLSISDIKEISLEWGTKLGSDLINYVETNDIILDFRENGVGYYWVSLNTKNSPEECKRMGHCGTSKNGYLYSLRSYTKLLGGKYTKNKSHLTASIDEDGTLYQLKGSKNSKPKSEYHKYIVPLFLINNFINKIGVEYDDKNDFKLTDLNDKDFIYLYEKRPELFYNRNLIEHLKSIGISIDVILDHKKISKILEPPYFFNLSEQYNITEIDDIYLVMKHIYSDNINIINKTILSNNKELYYESDSGVWIKKEYDSNGNQTYSENSNGIWVKKIYNENDEQVYYEDSDGKIIDKRNIKESKIIKRILREQVQSQESMFRLIESTTKSNGYIISNIVCDILVNKYLININNKNYFENLLNYKLEWGIDWGVNDFVKYKNELYYNDLINFLNTMNIHYKWYLSSDIMLNIYSNPEFRGVFIQPIDRKQSLIMVYLPKDKFIFENIDGYMEAIISATIHELQHAYDYYVSKGKNVINKKQLEFNKKYKTDKKVDNIDDYLKDYYDLPSEINARITQLLKLIDFKKYKNFSDLLDDNYFRWLLYSNKLRNDFVDEKMYKKILQKIYVSYINEISN